MSWNATFQVRQTVKCSECGTPRIITVQDSSESGCTSQLNHERREGLCSKCEAKHPDEQPAATGKLRFGKCICGKILPLGALALHRAEHARDKRTFSRRVTALPNFFN